MMQNLKITYEFLYCYFYFLLFMNFFPLFYFSVFSVRNIQIGAPHGSILGSLLLIVFDCYASYLHISTFYDDLIMDFFVFNILSNAELPSLLQKEDTFWFFVVKQTINKLM